MKNKSISMFLLLLIICVLTTSSLAQAKADSTTTEPEFIVPFYDYVSLVGASISMESLGKAVASGFVYYSGNYNSTLTIELQRSNGSGWTAVKSWSKSFSGRGQHCTM